MRPSTKYIGRSFIDPPVVTGDVFCYAQKRPGVQIDVSVQHIIGCNGGVRLVINYSTHTLVLPEANKTWQWTSSRASRDVAAACNTGKGHPQQQRQRPDEILLYPRSLCLSESPPPTIVRVRLEFPQPKGKGHLHPPMPACLPSIYAPLPWNIVPRALDLAIVPFPLLNSSHVSR